MHQAARAFLDYVKRQFPAFYESTKVLDVGAGDINGNNRHYFTNCEYVANDVVEAPNVTIVMKTSDLTFEDHTFDIVLSSECFEHDMHYVESLRNIVRMLKPGGLLAFTCASTGRPEHGTRRTSKDSYTLQLDDTEWNDYYKNLTCVEVCDAIDCDEVFSSYSFYYNYVSKDLYFWGLKKGGAADERVTKHYSGMGVVMTKKGGC